MIQHARLANGIPVLYVQHKTVPFTQANLRFDFGTVDDPAGKPGVINRMFQMLDEGAGGHDDHWFSQFRERSGVVLGGGAKAPRPACSSRRPRRRLARRWTS